MVTTTVKRTYGSCSSILKYAQITQCEVLTWGDDDRKEKKMPNPGYHYFVVEKLENKLSHEWKCVFVSCAHHFSLQSSGFQLSSSSSLGKAADNGVHDT